MTVQKALRKSAEELRLMVEAHSRLLVEVTEGGDTRTETAACPLLDCSHRRRFRETLADAITILEETRKAFKSKQLEALRKKLVRVLAEDA